MLVWCIIHDIVHVRQITNDTFFFSQRRNSDLRDAVSKLVQEVDSLENRTEHLIRTKLKDVSTKDFAFSRVMCYAFLRMSKNECLVSENLLTHMKCSRELM